MVSDAPAFGAIRGDEKEKAVAIKELWWLIEGVDARSAVSVRGMGYSAGKGLYTPRNTP